jgi:hypothetical protein
MNNSELLVDSRVPVKLRNVKVVKGNKLQPQMRELSVIVEEEKVEVESIESLELIDSPRT